MPELLAETTRLLNLLAQVQLGGVPAAAQVRAIALNNKGVGLLWTGRLDLAERYLWSGSTAARASGVELVEINATGHLALLEVISGSVREGARLAAAARDLAGRRGWLYALQTVAAHLAAALAHIERNDAAEAQRALQQGLRAHRADPEAAHRIVWLGARARLALAQGDPGRARTLLQQARRNRDARLRAPALDRWLLLAESEGDLQAGQPERVLARYAGADRGHKLTFHERVFQARAAFAMHDADRAFQLLAAADLPAAESVAIVEAQILSALIADAMRQAPRATEAFGDALALAEQEGIRRPFVSMGGGRLDSLAAMHTMARHGQSDLATDIPEGTMGQRAQPTGELSEREVEVLHYLPTMLTAGDIATELGVSVNTVKAHMRSIYRKLSAGRRQEAVTRAREHGLL